jgi:hypothetical protein
MSRVVSMAFVASCLLAFVGFLAGVHHITVGMHEQHPNKCEMTYMRPHYLPLPMTTSLAVPTPEPDASSEQQPERDQESITHTVALMTSSRLAYKYRLFRFENGAPAGANAFKPEGFPVLFVHGSGGSYGQVRSIGM